MSFDLQAILESEKVKLLPLQADDFESLYKVAADPLMWLQHPNKNRYKKSEFTNYFAGAMESGSAYIIIDKMTGDPIGCTRFYDYSESDKSVSIGYTFLAVTHWGKGYNQALKQLMMEHAFNWVDKIHFHIGLNNKRSRAAIEKIGAQQLDQKTLKSHAEDPHEGVIYQITPQIWADFLKEREEKEKEEEQ